MLIPLEMFEVGIYCFCYCGCYLM